MIEIINNQRKFKLDWQLFHEFAENAIALIAEAENKDLTIAFISDRKMRELNFQFRGKNSTTDVLSFPFEADEFQPDADTLGELVISLEQAEKQAQANNLSPELEIKQLILHGTIHLCGYDHETDDGAMNDRELMLREQLNIA